MSVNDFTPKTKDGINERIMMAVRQRLQPRAITIDATTEFLTL